MRLTVAAYVSLVPAGVVLVYYYLLALIAYFKQARRSSQSAGEAGARHFFLVLIPAHNEEATLATALASSLRSDYPRNQYQIYVIADNCTDSTATIARQHGVEVLERHDDVRRGKGFALDWAMDQIREKSFDAVMVLDADCELDVHALRTFDACLSRGDRILQASYVVSNPDESAISYAAAVGSVIENDLFYAPKSRLGLAVFLQGTGMVFHRSVLDAFPWRAHSIAEDTEYTILMLRQGIPVRFVGDVRVTSRFPATLKQLRVQRLRWASGNLRFGKMHALSLVVQGLAARNWRLADAGWTFLVLSRPLALLALAIALITTGVVDLLQPGMPHTALNTVAAFAVVAYGVYFVLGIIRLGITWRRLHLLLLSPFVVVSMIFISVLGVLGLREGVWARTPRGPG